MNKEVKVGNEFEIEEVIVEEKQRSPLHDWKVGLVLTVFILLFSSGAYAAYSGNASLFEKLLDAIVKIIGALNKG
jgi:putative effector of murein hydrolase